MGPFAKRVWLTLRRPPPLAISCIKATIALTLSVILPFIASFDALSARPVSLSWIVIVVIIGSAGKTVGGCIETVWLGLCGLGGGCFVFWVLGKIGQRNSPVGQGFVFAAWVYLSALVRYSGSRYISFYLIGVLFSFQGLYTSVADDPRDSRLWLLAYFEATAWGFALVLGVNLFVWPVTSESELRDLIISSLQHVSTLAHLTCKTYAREIPEDERDVRDLLTLTIRSDFSALSSRIDEASYEIVFSRWTMKDYRKIIAKVRGLQQALITSSSALELIDKLDPEGVNVKQHLLATEETAATFVHFRHSIDLVISDIIDQLSGLTLTELESRPHNVDVEKQTMTRQVSRQPSIHTTRILPSISARLRDEVKRSELRQQRLRLDSEVGANHRRPSAAAIDPHKSPVVFCRHSWKEFAEAQTEAIIRLIKDGSLQVVDSLRISEGMPSLQSVYSDRLPKAWTSSLISATPLRHVRPLPRGSPSHRSESTTMINLDDDDEEEDSPCSEALTKSYSLLFGLRQLTDELCDLHAIVCAPRKKRVQFHIFDRDLRALWRRDPESMTLQEALAALHGGVHKSPPVPFLHRVMQVETWLRSARSLYALKVALGATIYTILVLAESPRPFFIKYGMTSSLITVIVAISPSMGQTILTFMLQLLGTGIGSIYGMISLYIFKNVGGYSYNPYGVSVAIALWALATSYPFYKYPKYYTGTLLAMNGAGTIVVNEYYYNQAIHESYASPALRAGQAIASMCISIVIAAVFQIVIFRVPARHQLRVQIAAITFALSAYNTILQSNINAVAPADEAPVPPDEALQKIQKELIKRETKLQADIIALGPLYEFAAVEPQFLSPFRGEIILKIIHSHQLILDRLREGRTSVGTKGFSATVHHEFASTLYPYRLHSQRLARTLFYLSATSLISKTPLPRDVPSARSTWASFENDALVLSRRLSKRPDGEAKLREDGFLRYWFYLVVVGAVSGELEQLERYLGELFGVPEETNPNLS